jgi:hypothetical protein
MKNFKMIIKIYIAFLKKKQFLFKYILKNLKFGVQNNFSLFLLKIKEKNIFFQNKRR